MSKTWILLKTQIINFLPVNELRERKNLKQSTAVIMGAGLITLALFLCIYNILTAQALVQVGEQDLIPAYMVSVSGFAILLLTMFCSNGILFGSHDINMLFALPVKSDEIINSKFLFLYLLNFIIGFIFMVPGGIIWITHTNLNLSGAVLYFISVLFAPLIPMCAASCINILIVLASSHFKNRNILSLVFSFVAVGLIGYAGISGRQAGNNMERIGAALAKQLTGMYPLSGLFLANKSFSARSGICSFLFLSAAVYFLFIRLVSRKYELLNALSDTTSKYVGHKSMISKSLFWALYQKELGRFFSSYMAVLNTGLGVILLCTFSIILLIISPHQAGVYLGISDPEHFLCDYAPVIVASLLALSCPAASSLSLEGRNIWILQSSPVSVQMILNSKLAVNMTLHAFGYFFALFAIMIRLRLNFPQFAGLIVIPVCYSLFTAVLGIFLNVKYPNYTWDSEMIVVKQSTSVILSVFIGMVVIAAPLLPVWFFFFPILPTFGITAAILVSASAILYRKSFRSAYL